MNGQLWWYLARASGLVAWVLLIGSLVLGVLLATRVLKPLDRPAWLLAMHRWSSGLVVTAVALHVATLVADSYVHFGPREVLVPFASSWKSGAVTWGVVGMYLLVAVQATSLLMKRLPRRMWRAVHMGSYALAWVATVHAGSAGSDATNRVYQAVALMLSIVAVTAAVLRIMVGGRAARRSSTADAIERPVTHR